MLVFMCLLANASCGKRERTRERKVMSTTDENKYAGLTGNDQGSGVHTVSAL